MSKKAPNAEESYYLPLDISASINEFDSGAIQGGETCHVDDMKDTFAWMRGFVYAWYGFSKDGKTTLLDYMMVLKSKHSGYKHCAFKPENMDTVIQNGKAKIKANRIYHNLAWSLSGKTWNKKFAENNKNCEMMTLEERMEALDFIRQHFFVVYPENRLYSSMLDNFKFMYDKYKIDHFVWDPFNEIGKPKGARGDEEMVEVFSAVKKFAMETNSCFSIVNHPRTMGEVKEKDGSYKVVNQFMQLGGSAWDIKMDVQMSVNRPFRHQNPRDKRVHLYNLNTRDAEVIGIDRGVYKGIEFDPNKRQYYFDGLNPMDGSITEERRQRMNQEPIASNVDMFSTNRTKPIHKKEEKGKNFFNKGSQKPLSDDEVPF